MTLDVLEREGGQDRPRSIVRLAQSSRTVATAAALHRSGYGLTSRGEAVEGAHGTITMDEQAWAAARAAALSREPDVVTATIDVGTAAGSTGGHQPVTADVRVSAQVSFDDLLRALPTPVEQVAAHTSAAAPDYARDDALAPDPEVDCPPAVGGGLNLAYTGSREQVPKAANYLSALRTSATSVTCVHWAERGQRGRPTTQTLLVRLPLRRESWQPVLDVVHARRADLGSAHPAVVLLLPLPGGRLTAVFNLAEGEAPYVSALGAETTEQAREAQTAVQPLVGYWEGLPRP